MKDLKIQFFTQDEHLPIDFDWNHNKLYIVVFKSGEQAVCRFWPVSWSRPINKNATLSMDACVDFEFKAPPDRENWKFRWDWELVYTKRYYSKEDVVGWCEVPDLAKVADKL